MNKLIIGVCLTMIATSAFAEWTKYTETADGNQFFIDHATLKTNKKTKIKTVWTKQYLSDSSKHDGYKTLKMKVKTKCDDDLTQIEAIAYDDAGKVIASDNSEYKYTMPPDSANEATYNAICGKK